MVRDMLIRLVIEGAKTWRQCFIRNVGIGSIGDDFDEHDRMREEISGTVTGENDEKDANGRERSGFHARSRASRAERMVSIWETKNWPNLSTNSVRNWC